MEETCRSEARARARPSALEASSIVPKASIRGSSLAARPPPSSPVVPSSPVPDSSSIGLWRAPGPALLPADLSEGAQLPWHAVGFLYHFVQRHPPHPAAAPARDPPPPALPDF